MSLPFFDITRQSKEIVQQVIEQDGEVFPALERAMTEINSKIPAAVDMVVELMGRLEAEAEYFSEKSYLYTLIVNNCNKTRENLKLRVKEAMKGLGSAEMRGIESILRLQNVKARLIINDELLDRDYFVTRLVEEPDKDRIRAALERGLLVTGARLEKSHSLKSYVNKER